MLGAKIECFWDIHMLENIYLKGPKIIFQEDVWDPIFTVALFTIDQETTQITKNKYWTNEPYYSYTLGHYSSVIRDLIMQLSTTWMAVEDILLNENYQRIETNTKWSLLYGIMKRHSTNKYPKKQNLWIGFQN